MAAHFPLPSLSLLEKISNEATDAVAYTDIEKQRKNIWECMLLIRWVVLAEIRKFVAGGFMLIASQFPKNYLNISLLS